jgi:hypothetical protein
MDDQEKMIQDLREKFKGKSLHIMTPMGGGFCTYNYNESMIKLCLHLAQLGIPFTWANTVNESLVERARNRLVDAYLKNHEETHVLFIDADIGFDPMAVLAMLELDRDIVGAGCVKKNLRWDRVQKAIKKNGKTFTNEELATIAGDYIFNFKPGTVGQQHFATNAPLEVNHIGTGLMMIRRNVFETYQEAYPDRWYDSRGYDPADQPGPMWDFFRVGINLETRQYDSEDYWFCMDCRSIGFKVWMIPFVKTSHMGSYTFRGDMVAVAQLTGEL